MPPRVLASGPKPCGGNDDDDDYYYYNSHRLLPTENFQLLNNLSTKKASRATISKQFAFTIELCYTVECLSYTYSLGKYGFRCVAK